MMKKKLLTTIDAMVKQAAADLNSEIESKAVSTRFTADSLLGQIELVAGRMVDADAAHDLLVAFYDGMIEAIPEGNTTKSSIGQSYKARARYITSDLVAVELGFTKWGKTKSFELVEQVEEEKSPTTETVNSSKDNSDTSPADLVQDEADHLLNKLENALDLCLWSDAITDDQVNDRITQVFNRVNGKKAAQKKAGEKKAGAK